MKKIAVLVSGNGSNLQNLIDACKNKTIKNGKIILVISSNEKAFALSRAKKENIKTVVVSRSQFNCANDFDEALFNVLIQYSPDLIVLAGFTQLISKKIINSFKNKIINIHPSLIPSFCGKGCFGINVHKMALKRGVKVSGATVHFVNENFDEGPIIAQKAIEIEPDDTPSSLQQKILQNVEYNILPKVVNWFCLNRIKIKENIVSIEV